MTTCAQCRFENPPGMRFCGQCRAPLALHCPQCGSEVPPAFRFCGHCGASLAAAARLAAETIEGVATRAPDATLRQSLLSWPRVQAALETAERLRRG